MLTGEQAANSRPAPRPDETSAPFFEAAGRGLLLIQRCRDCGTCFAPVTASCNECLGEDLQWVEASGRGHLYTFGVMHQRYHPAFLAETPYNVAVVQLEEGPRLNTNIVGIANAELRVGMPLVVTFVQAAEGTFVPKFRPAAEDANPQSS